jgi:hypothetical protein
MSTEKIYYLAGPMSGIEQFNYPQFFSVAARLRRAGFLVVNPAEQDTPEVMRTVMSSEDGDLSKVDAPSWGEFLAHDVKLVADSVDAIVVLPGWEKSKGACTEVFIATLLGKPVHRGVRTERPVIDKYDRMLEEPGPVIDKEEISLILMKKLLA